MKPPLTNSMVSRGLAARARWHPVEIIFWVVAFSSIWLFPGKYLILTEIALLALFTILVVLQSTVLSWMVP